MKVTVQKNDRCNFKEVELVDDGYGCVDIYKDGKFEVGCISLEAALVYLRKRYHFVGKPHD